MTSRIHYERREQIRNEHEPEGARPPPEPPRQHLRGTYMNHDLGGAERSPSHTRDFKYTPAYIDMNKIRHLLRIN